MKPNFAIFALAASLLVTPVFAQTHDHSAAGHGAPSPAAAEVEAGDLNLSGAFVRATLPRAPVGGGFVTITNNGSTDDRLVSAKAPVGKEVQIHEMAHADGVMTMRELADGLAIPAGSTVTLEPGGYHLMLMGLTEPLVEGNTLDIELTFEKAGPVQVTFDIKQINARGDMGADHSGHEGHGDAADAHGDH